MGRASGGEGETRLGRRGCPKTRRCCRRTRRNSALRVLIICNTVTREKLPLRTPSLGDARKFTFLIFARRVRIFL